MQVGTIIKVIYFLIAIILSAFVAMWLKSGQERLETGEYNDFMRLWRENVVPLMNIQESTDNVENILVENGIENNIVE